MIEFLHCNLDPEICHDMGSSLVGTGVGIWIDECNYDPRVIHICTILARKNIGIKWECFVLYLYRMIASPLPQVSEIVLWDALLGWTKQECVRQSLEVNPENQRKVLGDCFSLVR